MTHKLYINAYFIIFGRPFRNSNLVPRLCRGGRCGCRYPRGPQQQLNKKYSDYDYAFPPKGSNLRKRPCRARDGVECYLCTVMLSIASQSIYTSVEPFNTEITSVSLL